LRKRINREYLDNFVAFALKEDIGDGDHTSLACIPPEQTGRAQITIKEQGVLAGMEMTKAILKRIDPGIQCIHSLDDGRRVEKGNTACELTGYVLSILKSERLILNILQRMSGIATKTRTYVDRLKDLNTKVLDTRKTTPGFRLFEKEAVVIGGGENHRMGLYDMILLKDNHIQFSGGIKKAIEDTHRYLKKINKDLKIEIEAHSLESVREILSIGGIHRIMLDNFTIEETKHAAAWINRRYQTESSGGITLANIREYAECGVDYVSVGDLTTHIKSIDMSLEAIY
jgi:nicotinate-nucleotide pyrophosphorylase (carboxylating)